MIDYSDALDNFQFEEFYYEDYDEDYDRDSFSLDSYGDSSGVSDDPDYIENSVDGVMIQALDGDDT